MAVNLASAYLSGRDTGPLRAILLITDGAPDCRPGAPDALTDDAAGTERAIEDAANDGASTFVVGLATAASPADATLSAMATAGGLARAASPAYYPAASSADIVTAMNALVAPIAGCTFSIPPPPVTDGTLSRADIAVNGDGKRLPQDAANGWTYSDANFNSMQLHGTACDAVRSGAIKAITIVFLCSTLAAPA